MRKNCPSKMLSLVLRKNIIVYNNKREIIIDCSSKSLILFDKGYLLSLVILYLRSCKN